MADLHNLLTQALIQNGITLPGPAQQKLVQFLMLIEKWNRVFNLTTILAPRGMVYLHLIDSLLMQPLLQGEHFLDVGTGGGLPGIPLAIANPQQHWTLLDKNSKKTRFLTQASAELGLTNVNVVHARSEEFHPEHCFDSILSRAFSSLSSFADLTAHLLCPHGILIAMKGKYPEDELADLTGRFHVKDVTPIILKGANVERHVVRMIRCD